MTARPSTNVLQPATSNITDGGREDPASEVHG